MTRTPSTPRSSTTPTRGWKREHDAADPDGSWSPATPIGWQEEHGRFARVVLFLLGRGHCGKRGWRTRGRLLMLWLILGVVIGLVVGIVGCLLAFTVYMAKGFQW